MKLLIKILIILCKSGKQLLDIGAFKGKGYFFYHFVIYKWKQERIYLN